MEGRMASSSRQVTLARSVVGCRCHVCAFFDRAQDRHEVFLPFIAEGLSAGDDVIHIIDHHDRAERMRLMIESGIDADAAEQSGRLKTIDWQDVYLRGGRFDQHAVLTMVDNIGVKTRRAGTVTRIWAEMGWASGQPPGVNNLVEYESRVDRVLLKYDLAVVCAYDVNSFSEEVIAGVLQAHPHAIIGRTLTPNTSYVTPDERTN
jgi:MEDS: MEthanogen/methylotroph, DcmR Sensory domain